MVLQRQLLGDGGFEQRRGVALVDVHDDLQRFAERVLAEDARRTAAGARELPTDRDTQRHTEIHRDTQRHTETQGQRQVSSGTDGDDLGGVGWVGVPSSGRWVTPA